MATDQPPTSNAEIITAVDPRIPLIDQRIKEEMSDLKASIEGHSASLATLERTQQELKNMLLMLCGHQAITVATAAASTSTSLAVSPVSLSGLRAIEGSVPTPAQSSTSTTSKSRGETFNLFILKNRLLNLQQVRLVRQQLAGRNPTYPPNLRGGHECAPKGYAFTN